MNIIEQAEHELQLLMLCKPSTVRGLIAEIQRLRALVKRHEDALKAVFSPLPYIPYIGEAVKFDSIPGGEKYAVRIYMTNESDGSVRARSFKGDTPLDAIEAAMKEERE